MGYFFALLPPSSPKNENIKRLKKIPGDNIILLKCTKNHDHMLYCSWDMVCAGCNCYFSFWAVFYPFTPLAAPKMKISKKWKSTPEDIIILHWCTKNHDHRLYCSWDMAHDGCNWYFLFWAIFCHFTPLAAGKMKMSKKIKKHLKISSFYTSVPKIMIRWCTVRFLRYGGQQADGWKKWHIEVGALPKNFITLKYQFATYYKNFITSTLLDIGPKAFSERG